MEFIFTLNKSNYFCRAQYFLKRRKIPQRVSRIRNQFCSRIQNAFHFSLLCGTFDFQTNGGIFKIIFGKMNITTGDDLNPPFIIIWSWKLKFVLFVAVVEFLAPRSNKSSIENIMPNIRLNENILGKRLVVSQIFIDKKSPRWIW